MEIYRVYLKTIGYSLSGEMVETTQLFDFKSSTSMSDFVQTIAEHSNSTVRLSIEKVEKREEKNEREIERRFS